MKLIPVDLSDRKFDSFISKIDKDKIYLTKIRDEWVTGRWSHPREWSRDGGGWDFNYGMSSTQGTCRHPSDELDKDFKEMYEIYDEELIVKRTIRMLSRYDLETIE